MTNLNRIFVAIAVHKPAEVDSGASGLSELPGAIKSAARVAKWAEENRYLCVRIFDDNAPVTASRVEKDIVTAIKKVHGTGETIDRIVIYFVGHGLGDKDEESYWLLSDWFTRPNENILISGLQRMLRFYHPRQVSIIGDACRTSDDALRNMSGNSILPKPGVAAHSRLYELDRFFAVGAGKEAYMAGESVDNSYCVFSEVLLNGLEGDDTSAFDPEFAGRRIVTSRSLALYLDEKVPAAAASLNKVMEAETFPAFKTDRVYAEFGEQSGSSRDSVNPPTLPLPKSPTGLEIKIDAAGKVILPVHSEYFRTALARGYVPTSHVLGLLPRPSTPKSHIRLVTNALHAQGIEIVNDSVTRPLIEPGSILPASSMIKVDESGGVILPERSEIFKVTRARGVLVTSDLEAMLESGPPAIEFLPQVIEEFSRHGIRVRGVGKAMPGVSASEKKRVSPRSRRAHGRVTPRVSISNIAGPDESPRNLLGDRRSRREEAASKIAEAWTKVKVPTAAQHGWAFVVSEASIQKITPINGGAAYFDSENSWWRVEVHGQRSPTEFADLTVELPDGRRVYVCAIHNFVTTLLFDTNSNPVLHYSSLEFRSDGIRRDGLALLARANAGLLPAIKARSVAALLREGKHTDLTLGCVAAYLYDSIGDVENIRRIAYYYQFHGQPVPLDVAILSGGEIFRRGFGALRMNIPATPRTNPQNDDEVSRGFTFIETPEVLGAAIAGLMPWMRAGWFALDAILTRHAATKWRDGLREKAKLLTPAMFTTFGSNALEDSRVNS